MERSSFGHRRCELRGRQGLPLSGRQRLSAASSRLNLSFDVERRAGARTPHRVRRSHAPPPDASPWLLPVAERSFFRGPAWATTVRLSSRGGWRTSSASARDRSSRIGSRASAVSSRPSASSARSCSITSQSSSTTSASTSATCAPVSTAYRRRKLLPRTPSIAWNSVTTSARSSRNTARCGNACSSWPLASCRRLDCRRRCLGCTRPSIWRSPNPSRASAARTTGRCGRSTGSRRPRSRRPRCSDSSTSSWACSWRRPATSTW